jgi:ATP-binding cassette subfamily C (CFTR/MRP) protein 1
MEHTRTVRPSLLLDLYLLFSLLFDIAHTRTLWLRQGGDSNRLIAILSSLGVGIKLVLLFLELWQKKKILKFEYRDYPPEALAGTPNRAFFWWLNPLFVQGFSKSLRVEDLSVLDKKLHSRRLRDQLDSNWKTGM